MRDAPALSRFTWRKHPNGYATHIDGDTSILLHRLLMPGVDEVDHIDQNKLNNTRANLRACSHLQNCHNRGISAANTSGALGVSYVKSRDRWLAQICIDGKKKNLGRYKTRDEAEAVYKAAKERVIQQVWSTT